MAPPAEKKFLPFPPGDDRAMGYYLAFIIGAALIAGVAIAGIQFFGNKNEAGPARPTDATLAAP